MSVRFVKPLYFIWIVVPVAIYLGYQIFGLPHFIWSYDFRASSYDPSAQRFYTRCTYLGPYGTFTTYPENGTCGWWLFKKSGGV